MHISHHFYSLVHLLKSSAFIASDNCLFSTLTNITPLLRLGSIRANLLLKTIDTIVRLIYNEAHLTSFNHDFTWDYDKSTDKRPFESKVFDCE